MLCVLLLFFLFNLPSPPRLLKTVVNLQLPVDTEALFYFADQLHRVGGEGGPDVYEQPCGEK